MAKGHIYDRTPNGPPNQVEGHTQHKGVASTNSVGTLFPAPLLLVQVCVLLQVGELGLLGLKLIPSVLNNYNILAPPPSPARPW